MEEWTTDFYNRLGVFCKKRRVKWEDVNEFIREMADKVRQRRVADVMAGYYGAGDP